MIEHFVSVDIGSTWTKAARLALHDDRFFVEKRSVVPTTIDHLPDGFYSALNLLDDHIDWVTADSAPIPVVFSSSAKGGLRVAVVGLVPEMSLQIARLAACSAGARVVGAFPYRLTRSCIARLEQMQPDILLLCGGTDGGNERYVCENAIAISRSRFNGTIIYAGNNQAAENVSDVLRGRDLHLCENLMPDFGRLNIEPARSAIRDVFLDRIVAGKGLEKLVAQFRIEPLPTPLAVFNLVEAIGRNLPEWQNFALIDMGGATTDIYSYPESFHQAPATVLKGIIEPRLKRSVEGDLGMRVSAASVLAVAE
ncbi:MAG: glutamate mutase L, partial [Candidatus Riflebacteria bacterium]